MASLIRTPAFVVLAVLAAFLIFGRGSQTQATNPAPAALEYKVELVKHKKDLEAVLNEDARNGWRVQRVVAMGPSNNELVVILEKPGLP